MSEERGMKKYLPFASLVEQETELNKMLYEKNKTSKPLISTENAEKINKILTNYNQDEDYTFKLFYDGYIYKYTGSIIKIDKYKKRIFFKEFSFPLKDIIDIESNDYLYDVL